MYHIKIEGGKWGEVEWGGRRLHLQACASPRHCGLGIFFSAWIQQILMVAARAVFSMTGSILHAPQMFSLSSRPLYGMSALLFFSWEDWA